MNTIDKLIKSWWVILSFVMFLNGFGFIYIGFKHSNRNWIIEGLMYEIPWFFYFVYYAIYGMTLGIANPTEYVLLFAFLLQLVGIVRSFWVAIKLWDVYDNNDKYAHNPVELKKPFETKQKDKMSSSSVCCLCVAIIFIIFVIIAI